MNVIFTLIPSIFIACQQETSHVPVSVKNEATEIMVISSETESSEIVLSEESNIKTQTEATEPKHVEKQEGNRSQHEHRDHATQANTQIDSLTLTENSPTKKSKTIVAKAKTIPIVKNDKSKKTTEIVSIQKEPSPLENIVIGIEETYAQIHSLDLDFEQVIQNDALDQELVQTGSMHMMKPGLFLWDVQFPMEQQYYVNGTQVRVWNPMNQQLLISQHQGGNGDVSSILHDLSSISEKYRVELLSQNATTIRLMAYPQEDIGCESLQLTMSAQGYQLKELTSKCSQTGDVQISFSRPRVNTRTNPAIFHWSPPEGVEVISSTDVFD